MDTALEWMILFYSIGFFRLFERIGLDKVKELARAASDISGYHDLVYECNKRVTYTLPHCDGPQSPGKVLAAMAAAVAWPQLLAGNNLPDSPFLKAASDGWKFYKLAQREPAPELTRNKKRRKP